MLPQIKTLNAAPNLKKKNQQLFNHKDIKKFWLWFLEGLSITDSLSDIKKSQIINVMLWFELDH